MIRYLKILAALSILSLINAFIWWTTFKNGQLNLAEHSSIEMAQAAEIVLAGLLFLVAAFKNKGLQRIFCFNLFLLAASFFFREVKLTDFYSDPISQWFSEDFGLNLTMSISWSSFTLYYLFHFKEFLNVLTGWVKSPAGVSIILCGVCLVASVPFDKAYFDLTPTIAKFWEEFSEVNGFLLLLTSAVLNLFHKEP